MQQLTENDAKLAAFAAAVADVLANHIVKQEAALKTLGLKGLVSETELVEAMHSIPVELVERVSLEIGQQIRDRMTAHYNQMFGAGGPVQ